MKLKEWGVIESAKFYQEDRGFWTCTVMTMVDNCSSQGFGCLVLKDKEQGEDFVRELCSVFRVGKLKQLIGKRCARLYCFGYHNETIRALEAENGNRFVIEDWVRKYHPDSKGVLEAEISRLASSIAMHERRAREDAADMRKYEQSYTPVSEIPLG